MDDEKNLTLVGHLEELRTRLIISLVVLCVSCTLSFTFSLPVLQMLSAGLKTKLIFLAPFDAFMARFKVALLLGLLFSMPVFLLEFWLFIKPALKLKEKKYAVPFVFGSALCFYLGVLFAYFFLPTWIQYLLSLGGDVLQPQMTAENYIGFIFSSFLISGLLFEFPVVILLLSKLNIVTAELLQQKRKYALFGIVAAVAVITPSQDALTLIVYSVILIILYELSILLVKMTR